MLARRAIEYLSGKGLWQERARIQAAAADRPEVASAFEWAGRWSHPLTNAEAHQVYSAGYLVRVHDLKSRLESLGYRVRCWLDKPAALYRAAAYTWSNDSLEAATCVARAQGLNESQALRALAGELGVE